MQYPNSYSSARGANFKQTSKNRWKDKKLCSKYQYSYQTDILGKKPWLSLLPTKLNFYKQIRPSHILGSGDMAFKVINTFKNHYINPFDPFLEKKTLCSLSSGAAMPADVTDYLLLLHEKGKDLCKDFLPSRILTLTKSFHNKITRNNIKMLLTKKASSSRT